MAKFIVLTDHQDNPICVNVDKIEYIQRPLPDEEIGGECYTEVALNHKTIYVKQVYKEIVDAIDEMAALEITVWDCDEERKGE